MGLIVGMGGLLLSMFILNDLISDMMSALGKREARWDLAGRLVRAPLLWLFIAGCAITVMSGTQAGALTAEEGRSFFAMSLAWCGAIMVGVRWIRARANGDDEG